LISEGFSDGLRFTFNHDKPERLMTTKHQKEDALTTPGVGRRLAFSGFLAGLLLPFHLSGADPDTTGFSGTSLQAYLERAQSANPGLRAFEDHYEASMRRIPRAGSLPDPRIQITSFVESVQTRTGTQENVVTLAQTVPWFGKLNQAKAVASAEAEALWFAYQARQLALARTVASGFFEYGYLARSLELTRQSLILLRRLESVVEERVRGGGDINPLLRLQVEIGMMEDRENSILRTREAQSARLNGLLAQVPQGLLSWPEWTAPEPEPLDLPGLLTALEANNPELAMLDRKVSSAEARRELAALENRPELTFGVNYIQTDAYPGSSAADAGNDPWGITVGLSIPIWAGKNEAVRGEALAAKSAAEQERRDRKKTF
jgi:outer membrane protein TolC